MPMTAYEPRALTFYAVVDPMTGRTLATTGHLPRAVACAETCAEHLPSGACAVVEVPACNN